MFPVNIYIQALRDMDINSAGFRSFLAKAPYVIAIACLFALFLFANKMWATNDDAGMAMVAEGYGIAGAPSPGLVFSSVIWGWLLMHLPRFSFIEPYFAVTYILLGMSCLAITASLHRLRAPATLGAATLLAMYTIVIIHPQFTIVAGYLAVAGLAVLYAWKDSSSRTYLLVAGSLFLLAGLIRNMELLLVVFISMPVLFVIVWDGDRQHRCRLIALAAILALLLGASMLVDSIYYSSSDWAAFRSMQDIRLAFTDYHLRAYFGAHHEAFQSKVLTPNDLMLISHWFVSDGRIFNQENFAPLVASVPLMGRMSVNTGFWWQPLKVITSTQFMLLIGMSFLPLLLCRGKKTAALLSLLLLTACMAGLFLLGRGGIARIYIPVTAALLILGMMTLPSHGRRHMAMYAAGAATMAWCIWLLIQGWGASIHDGKVQRSHDLITAKFCALPKHDLLVIWGNLYFQYSTLYDQSAGAAQGCDMHLYGIASLQLAPYSTDNLYRATGYTSVVDALLNGRTLYMYTQTLELSHLETYLAEHYGSKLSYSVVVTAYKNLNIYAVQATPASPHTAPPGGWPDSTSTEEPASDPLP